MSSSPPRLPDDPELVPPCPPPPPQVVVNMAQPPKWTRWVGRALLSLSIMLNVVLLIAVGGLADSPSFVELRYAGPADAKSKIALIHLNGTIEPEVVKRVRRRLRLAVEDKAIKAIVLRIDSPGGHITSSDTLYHLVAEADKTKPVVASMADMAASGAYYVAAACRHIVAQRTTVTGSIGVIMTLPNVRKLLGEKLGVEMSVLTSGKMKDAGSPFREMTQAEREYFQRLVDEMFARFKQVVRTGRNLPAAEVDKVADGSIFTGPKALELKLVDQVGYLGEAIDKARQLAGVTGPSQVVQYQRSFSLSSLMMGQAGPSKVEVQIGPRELDALRGARLMYLWAPGALDAR
jgi:protease IV